jgi:hypothetical protein
VSEFGELQRSGREVLQAAVGGGVLLASGSLLAACGSQASRPTRQSTVQAERGGQLHAGVTGGSSSDSIDPAFLLSTVDVKMQQLEFSRNASGYIIPYFLPQIDGYASSVHGLNPSRTGIPFGGADFKQLWLS